MFSSPEPPPPPDPPKPLPPPRQPDMPPDTGKGTNPAKAGLMSTILTSPQGDLTPAKTAKKTLLGGS